MDITESMDGGP